MKALLTTLAAALVAAPLAVAWGAGHARVEDYLGPHRASFASNYSGGISVLGDDDPSRTSRSASS